MAANSGQKRCSRCRALLASDNITDQCSPCRHATGRLRQGPPIVPSDFWNSPAIQKALANRHMGELISAYRSHPHHGRPIPQDVVALWATTDQSKISRIERSAADRDIGRLTFWARLLGVPEHLLWFKLPGRPTAADTAGTPTAGQGAGLLTTSPSPEPHTTIGAPPQHRAARTAEAGPAHSPPRPHGPAGSVGHAASADAGRMLGEPGGDTGSLPVPPQSELLARVAQTISGATTIAIGDDAYRQIVADLVRWAKAMKRRDVLQWLTWAASTAAASLEIFDDLDPDERGRTAAALIEPGRVDATVVGHIDAILWRCMRQDDVLGPQAALNTVLAQRDLVQSLLVGACGSRRDDLLTLLANLSRFAGWLSFDLGNFDAASGYYEAARVDAHEARNTELGVLVLCNMSHLATWRGKPRVGIDHALAAQGWASQTGDRRLRAYAYDVAARAFASDRRENAAKEALDRARIEIGEAQGESHWAYFFDAAQLESTKAVCLLSLGQADEAATVAQAAVDGIDPSFVRNLGISSTYLGVAHLHRRKPEVAAGAAALADAIRLAGHNRSVRLAQTLQSGLQDLKRWRDEPAARATLKLAKAYHLA